jgi:hypothetical protein
MAVLGATTLTGCNSIPSFIPSGTKMIFNMATSPSSWTKDTNPNSLMLRVINGTASPGGSLTFPQVFASRPYSATIQNAAAASGTLGPTTPPYQGMPNSGLGNANSSQSALSSPQMVSHNHPYQRRRPPPNPLTRTNTGTPLNTLEGGAAPSVAGFFGQVGSGQQHSHSINIQHTHPFPTIGAHTHTISFPQHTHTLQSGSITQLSLLYVDFIISSKN